MFKAIPDFLDAMLEWGSRLSKEPAASFCELETVDTDGKTLIAADGSLGTIVDFKGSSRLVGNHEYGQIVKRLSNTLDSFLKKPGHTVQVFWVRDPDGAAEIVQSALAPARAQARLLQLDFEDVLDEKERELVKWVCHEAVYFVLWTHPAALTPAELKAARAEQKASNKKFEDLTFLDAQNPRKLLAALRNRHNAFVSSLTASMRQQSLVVDELDGHEALRAVRYTIDPSWTPRSWRATIPGDRIPARFPMRENEASALWWPPLGSQVWPRDAYTKGNCYVEIGDRVHAPMYVEVPATRVEPFQRLIRLAIDLDREMPFSVSFVLRGGGMKTKGLQRAAASVLRVLSSYNPQIHDALTQLTEIEKEEAVVSLQLAFNTWAPVGEEVLLRRRASTMAQVMIDWGGNQVREVSGDPLEGFASNALALTPKSIASVAAAPLLDAVTMLPLARPASPWASGAELFTSIDGKLMPYQPGSKLQATWINIFIGGPGSGKSMQMFKQHLATVLAPQGGVNQLPPIAVIDIGPSASGLSSMLQSALPANLRHQVNHHRLRNTPEFAYNPFEPPLGMDQPLPDGRAYLVDLLTMLATPAETGVAYEGTAELAGMVLDEMYAALANNQRGRPRPYYPNVDPQVDAALHLAGIDLPQNACWYEVRDLLFQAKNPHAAQLAARYGAPLLSDAASAARSATVRDTYGKKFTAGAASETLPEAFSRMIASACREYQILSQPTRFDLGESRVTILDLDEVAKSGGPAGAKQTAIMYALALYMLSRDFTLTKDALRDIPEMYRDYHYARVQSVEKELKTICCDEFHRTSQSFSTLLRERIKVFAREGRKWNIQLMLGSQRLADFDEELIDMSTGVFIMERPDENLVVEYQNRFGLTDTERYNLSHHVHAPTAGGGCFFVRMKMKSGNFNQLLRNPAGPIELWAGATTSEDKSVRTTVYAALGPVNGRAALAAAYPGGSAKGDADQRKEQMILRGESNGNAEKDVYDQISAEVVHKFQERRSAEIRAEVEQQKASERRRSAIAESLVRQSAD